MDDDFISRLLLNGSDAYTGKSEEAMLKVLEASFLLAKAKQADKITEMKNDG